jgi:cell wall-associated NlpC family hydrolase
VKQYVGIPFEQQDCWTLCCTVYQQEFGIRLPRIGEKVSISPFLLHGPAEGCLVRVVREAPLSEHWGIYCAGYVLHAQKPSSVMVPIRRFMQNHAKVQFLKVVQ